ncbi:hypothetical protein [Lolliginicoccus levis]|uniref:hypothetical protein n=1 Tax=Lolliginicoccus levis TaxID=2919542 RepID=UPI00241CC80E|nr:hypothetical protein [Lolliginicoccus levis]
MMAAMYVIGAGPTELHAHIDLHYRARDVDHRAALAVISTANHAGHWSVVAEIQPSTTGEGR